MSVSRATLNLSTLFLASLFLLGSCNLFTSPPAADPPNTDPGDTATPPGDAVTFDYTEATPVLAVNFAAATENEFTLTVNGAAGRQIFLMKANPSDTEVVATGTGLGAPKSLLRPATGLRNDLPAEQRFRQSHAGLAPAPTATARGLSRSVVSYGTVASGLTEGTSTKQFWIDAADGSWSQLTAKLQKVTEHCYLWVPGSYIDDTSASSSDNKLTATQLDTLAIKFEDVFTYVTTLYGFELGGGPGGDGGVDGDQHVSILLYDIEGDYSATQSGGTMGYFWSKDEATQASLGSANTDPKTNLAELFYVDAFFADNLPGDTIATLAHEYTHMICYNQKNVVQQKDPAAWYNEMCAMTAEDLVLAKLGLDQVAMGAQNRMPGFLVDYAASGVTDWLAAPDDLKSYASAFTFGAFLARNFGGANFFHSLMGNSTVDTDSIAEALQSNGSQGTFPVVFNQYLAALVYSATPTGSDILTLNKTSTSNLGGQEYIATAIDLWALDQSGSDPAVKGLAVYANDGSGQTALRPWGFTLHRLADSASSTASFTLTKPSVAAVEYWVMVK